MYGEIQSQIQFVPSAFGAGTFAINCHRGNSVHTLFRRIWRVRAPKRLTTGDRSVIPTTSATTRARAHTLTHALMSVQTRFQTKHTRAAGAEVSGRSCFLLSSHLRKQPPLFLAQIHPPRSPPAACGRCLRTPSGALRRRLYRSRKSSGYSRSRSSAGHVTSGAPYEVLLSKKEARSNTAVTTISCGHPSGSRAVAAEPGLGVVEGSCLP